MMRTFTVLLFLGLMLTACAHGAKRVDCEAHVTAINAPTLKEKVP